MDNPVASDPYEYMGRLVQCLLLEIDASNGGLCSIHHTHTLDRICCYANR